MELIAMDMENDAYRKYERAKKRVEEIKGFYNHIKVFILINIIILVMRFYVLPKLGIVSDDKDFENWLTWNTFIFPGIWSVVILFHGLRTYRYKLKFLKGWEERKIKEYMEKDSIEE